MARWLAFFAEFTFRVEYKPGATNVFADAISRCPDYELSVQSPCSDDHVELNYASVTRIQNSLASDIRQCYDSEDDCR